MLALMLISVVPRRGARHPERGPIYPSSQQPSPAQVTPQLPSH